MNASQNLPILQNSRRPQVNPVVVQNYVFHCKTDLVINVQSLARKGRFLGAQLNPVRFSSVINRTIHPRVTNLFSRNGAFVSTGSRNKEEGRFAINAYVDILSKLTGYKVKLLSIKMENIVGTATLPYRLDLVSFHKNNTIICNYDPDAFPGAVIRIDGLKKLTILAYITGELVFTGGKLESELQEAYWQVLPLLEPYKVENTSLFSLDTSTTNPPVKKKRPRRREYTKESRDAISKIPNMSDKNVWAVKIQKEIQQTQDKLAHDRAIVETEIKENKIKQDKLFEQDERYKYFKEETVKIKQEFEQNNDDYDDEFNKEYYQGDDDMPKLKRIKTEEDTEYFY